MDNDLQKKLDSLESRLDNLLRLQRMILLSSGSAPVTVIGNTFVGAQIDPDPGLVPSGNTSFFRLYENNLGRLVSAKIVANFNVPGATANISLTSDPSGNGIIQTLSSGGPVISNVIWVKPDSTIYINTADPTFSLFGSTFRVLVFDPLSFRDFLGGGV
jgi:hypothetical protein